MRLKIIKQENVGDGVVLIDVNIQNGIRNKIYTYKVNESVYVLAKVLINRNIHGTALQALTKNNLMKGM